MPVQPKSYGIYSNKLVHCKSMNKEVDGKATETPISANISREPTNII